MDGVKGRNNEKGRESNENECVYTDIQKSFRLNEKDPLCEGLKAFKQTDERTFLNRAGLDV